MKLVNQNDYPDVIYITKTSKPDFESGLKTTIKSSGCGICCGMMLAEFFGYELSMQDAINLSYEYKANTSAGTKYKEYSYALSDRFDLYIERTDKIDKLYECLDDGGCAIVNVGGDHDEHLGYFSHIGHYIFIEKHIDNELYILDPGIEDGKYAEEHRKNIKIEGEYVIADSKYLVDDIQNRESPIFLYKKNRHLNDYADIKNEIESLNNEFISIWEDIVKIDSPTKYKEGVDKVEKYFLDYAARQIWNTEEFICEKAGNALLITMNPNVKGKPIVLSGHMDTVHPVGSLKTRIDKNRLYGPGATDCKGGLIVCLLAMKALKNLGYKERQIRFLLQSDEEVGSSLSEYKTINWMIDKSKDALCFINTEKYEDNTVVIIRKGICKYEIEIKGISTHAARCFEGASAIKEAAYKIIELEKLQDPENITISIGTINGGTAVNVVPDNCSFTIDVRYNSNDDLKVIEKYISDICYKTYIEGTSTEIRFLSNRPCMEYKKENEDLVDRINEVFREAELPAVKYRKTMGGSDGAYMTQNNIPTIDSIGVGGDFIHSKDEYADIDTLALNAKRIACIIYGVKDE